MKTKFQFNVLLAVLMSGMLISSCGNVDIVKRKYRPGFHVDVSKKRQKSKATNKAAVADVRRVEKLKAIASRQAELKEQTAEPQLTAEVGSKKPARFKLLDRQKMKELKHSADFRNLSFKRKMKVLEREVLRPQPRANTEWMKWVSFGTGIGSMAFGFLALLFAFLLASSAFIWPAMLLSAAAITFAIIYRNMNGTDPKSRLGLIFGIVGGGLAVIALIVWAIWVSLAIAAVA